MDMTDRIAAIAISFGATIASMMTNDITTPIIGVGVATVVGSVMGGLAAIGWDQSKGPRGQALVTFMSAVVTSCFLVGFVPKAIGWHWSTGGTESALAGATSIGLYFFLPPVIKRAKELIAGFRIGDIPFFRRGTLPPANDPKPSDEEKP